ncbi:hypothetical protein WA026_011871 [Henosepilachna vigintioctopunctata]|uniref:Potassium channel domain-containing protein n=1 Tax=Henosepilachna vigintioctopunctata TaxID=420089 RepID=A0AAW1UDN1_9CUCU
MERKRSVRRHRRGERSFAKRCKDYIRHFVAFLFSNLGIIGLVIGYTMGGALIFRSIEKDYHLQVKTDVVNAKMKTISEIWNFTIFMNPFLEEEYKDMLEDQLMNFQTSIVRSVRKGYDGSRLSYSEQWSIAGAFLYSLTLITTIGYGNITTHTMAGQIMTIFYAIIGMPLFLLYLSNIGDLLAKSFKWIYANICLCRWCPGVASRRAERKRRAEKIRYYSEEDPYFNERLRSEENEDQKNECSSNSTEESVEDSEESYDVESVTVPITVCLMIMVGYICFGGFLFCKWEDWRFLEAAYFCFISLSTIGFGDFVPGDKIIGHSDVDEVLVDEVFELRFVFCAVYLMLGMALIAMCFNLMQVSETLYTYFLCLSCNEARIYRLFFTTINILKIFQQ